MNHYTVNTSGNNVQSAKEAGYNAYYANGVTAIEIAADNKQSARSIASRIVGANNVLYVFE